MSILFSYTSRPDKSVKDIETVSDSNDCTLIVNVLSKGFGKTVDVIFETTDKAIMFDSCSEPSLSTIFKR